MRLARTSAGTRVSATEKRHDEEKLGVLIWLYPKKDAPTRPIEYWIVRRERKCHNLFVFCHSSKTIGSMTAKSRIRSPSVLTNKQTKGSRPYQTHWEDFLD